MAINPVSANNAYQNQLKLMKDAAEGSTESKGGPSFMDMVQSAVKDAADTQFKAEDLQMQSLTDGKVELSNLVTAVANADLSLHTVIAVRDRVINAYQDIIKMAI